MKKKIIRNPKGSKDLLPNEVNKQEFIRKTLIGVFESWGYRPIQTPVLINRDTLNLGSNSLANQAFNLIGESGDVLALRADLTTPIARVTAERLQEVPLPLRFYYVGKVFRYEARKNTNEREHFQIGVELIGKKEGLADLECLKILNDSINKAGLKKALIVLNHSGLWSELFNVYGNLAKEIYSALSRKDLVEFNTVLDKSNLSSTKKGFWKELIKIKGGKEALKDLKKVAKSEKKLKLEKVIRYFNDVFALFDEGVEIDLSLTSDLDYYTGVYFEVVAPFMGRSIGSGGRYDNLIGKFGYDVPAIGFSFSLEDLLISLQNQGKKFQSYKKPVFVKKNKNIKSVFKAIEKNQKSGKVSSTEL